MKKILMITAALAAFSAPAFASGSHEGGHGQEMMMGGPGQKTKVTQTIMVTMRETDDGKMIFLPATIKVKEGQTVKFMIRNSGGTNHEFVFAPDAEIMEHKALMEKFPEMEHDDPNAISLEPGKTGEIVWKFGKTGTFTFACLVPGHYAAGMHGKLVVAKK